MVGSILHIFCDNQVTLCILKNYCLVERLQFIKKKQILHTGNTDNLKLNKI